MKQLFLSFLLICSLFTVSAQDVESEWDRANTLYVNENYDGAIEIYDSLLSLGNTSAKLYYNLANAHFKESNIAKAVLYYNKALKLSPLDKDIQHNLLIANGYVKDKIEEVPEFVIKSWMRSLRQSLSSNAWTYLALVFLVVALALVLVYLLSTNRSRRKLGFLGALLFLFLTSYSLIFANTQLNEVRRSASAVIMNDNVAVKSSPSTTSTDLFVLNQGTVVKVVQRLGEWYEIIIADGNKGWLERSKIESI